MTTDVKVGDEEIAFAAKLLGCQFDDEPRKAVLRCVGNMDLQAAPGSGKTTLVVAKLAIMAQKWRFSDRGICVLSHTNVARREVEVRLTGQVAGHTLLRYPHFIGTIQRFVDRFFAIPFLRNQGFPVVAVDNDRFGDRVLQLLDGPQYAATRYYLSNKPNLRMQVSSLRYSGPALDLECPNASLPSKGKVLEQLSSLKRRISQEGIFRFDDMYAFAERYLETSPAVIQAARYRFPLVLIDEMQDTDDVQERFLENLFGIGCIVQRFGDVNQAIFSEEGGGALRGSFPRDGHLTLDDSARFGPTIAGVARRLAAERQDFHGNEGVKSRPHTVFIFDRNSIGHVLPAYGDLLLDEFAGVEDDCVAKAVASRKTPGTGEKFPHTIGDYWPEFEPERSTVFRESDRLIDYVTAARQEVRDTAEYRNGARLIYHGVARLLNLLGFVTGQGERFGGERVRQAIEMCRRREELESLVYGLCSDRGELDVDGWGEVVAKLTALLPVLIDSECTAEEVEFLGWRTQHETAAKAHKGIRGRNIYTHQRGERQIEIEVGTIHGVKAETHDSTLVLETAFRKSYDLQRVLPFLTGDKQDPEAEPESLRDQMRRLFVGVTRPRELVCLAIFCDHLTADHREQLCREGWILHDLTN